MQSPKEFSFVVLGDNRGGHEIFQGILKEIDTMDPTPLFIVNTGDFVSSGTENQYRRFLEMIRVTSIPFIVIPGNHDYYFGGKKRYKRYFGRSYFYFDLGENLRFIFLDNADSGFGRQQLDWLSGLLDTQRRTFLFMHRPPPIQEWCYHPFIRDVKEFLNMATLKRGVTGVFCSHIHGYSYKEHKGVRYIVTGGAGARLMRHIPKVEPINHYVIVRLKADGTEWKHEKRVYKPQPD
jgi:3',5'-cyclic AMP phosphodiesterase CpdA